MQSGNLKFKPMLEAIGLTSGPVYATGLLKGRDAARMVADCKAQETIHADHDRILANQYLGAKVEDVQRLNKLHEMRSDESVHAAGVNWLEIEISELQQDIVRNGSTNFHFSEPIF